MSDEEDTSLANAERRLWLRYETQDRPKVECDEDCLAFENPETLNEYADALVHWQSHSVDDGCSHGR